MNKEQDLNYTGILKYWLPLASTWIMMAIEGPYLSAIVARMDFPVYNLAAFGVTFAFGLLIEAPVIMLMAAATRLVKDRGSFNKMRNFSFFLSAICTGVMLLSLIPALFDLWSRDLLQLKEEIRQYVWLAVACMLPWPGMIGIRRFYQGVLISQGHTKRLALGTILRLLAMSGAAYIAYEYKLLHGAASATLSLSAGVTCEAIYVTIVSLTAQKQVKQIPGSSLSYSKIAHFYYPLALTTLIGLTVQPLVTFAINRGYQPVESLAVIPVVNGIVFFFRAIPLSFQEVIIALMGEKQQNLRILRLFALYLGLFLTLALAFIALTPLASLWFQHIAGLNPSMAAFAGLPLIICIAIPASSLWLCWQRSMLICIKTTAPVTYASLIELATVIGLLVISIGYGWPMAAVSLAMIALVIGRLAANAYLQMTFDKMKRVKAPQDLIPVREGLSAD